MKIDIKATNLELTQDLKDFIEQKISSLEKFAGEFDSGAQAWVEVGVTTKHHRTGDIFRAEIQISLPEKNPTLRTESVNIDLRTAIEEAKDQMKLELLKAKEKNISLARKGARLLKDLIRSIPFFRQSR